MKTQTTHTGSKSHFIFLGMLFTLMLFGIRGFGQFTDFKPTQILSESWSGTAWQNSSRVFNTYESHGYLTNYLVQNWEPSINNWQNSIQATYTNNASGAPTQVITQVWDPDTSTWTNVSRSTYTYTGANKLLTLVTDSWFGTDWLAFSSVTNTYDGNQYLTNSLFKSIDFVTQTLKNTSQVNYTNNPNGSVNFEILQTWTPSNTWENSKRTAYTYNGSGAILVQTVQTWNSTASLFENSERTTNTYKPNGKILTITTEKWLAGNWVNSTKDTSTYDGSDYLVNVLSQDWDVASSAWENDAQSLITNNASGIPIQVVSQDWDEANGRWVNVTRTTLSYGQLGINDFDARKLFAVYPVPAYDRIMIKANEDIEGLNYFIADQTGRIFKRGTFSIDENFIDINQLATGVYFLQLGSDKNQAFKIIKR